MKRVTYLITATVLALCLSGCSSSKQKLADKPVFDLYHSAQTNLQEGNYRQAIIELEALDNRYPFSAYSQQAQLDLVYAYYKTDDVSLAQASIDRFMRLNPTSSATDYLLYLRGVTNMTMDRNFFQQLFHIDRSDRDNKSLRIAFADFKRLINNYPTSPYASDAQKRMIAIYDDLANYDLAVAQFYTKKNAYVAVINRTKAMMQYYPESKATRNALVLMANAYQQLNLPRQAEQINTLLTLNKDNNELF